MATRSEGAVPGQTSAGPFRAPNPSPRQFHPPGPAARRRPTSSLRLTTFRDTPTRLTWRLRPGPRHAEESRARRGGAGRGAGAGRVEGRASPGFQDRATEEALAAGRRGRGAAERAAPQGPDEAGSRPYPLLTPRWRPVLPRSPPGPAPVLKRGFGSPGSPGSGGRGEVLIPDSLRPARSPLALSFHPPQGPERARGPHPARTAALRTNAGTGVAGEQREGAVQVPSCSMCARPRPPTHRTRTGATGAARLSRSFLSGSGDGAGVRRPPLPCRRVAPSRALG